MSEYGLRPGSAEIQSAGPITFGPAGILFLADNASARVLAVDVADPGPASAAEPFDLADVDARIGSYLGCEADDVDIRDMAVHPVSRNVYLSVQRGRGEGGQAVLVRIDVPDGTVTDVPLGQVPVAEAVIGDAPAEDDERQDVTLGQGEEVTFSGRTIRILRRPIRTSTITDMVYVGGDTGTLLVAGLSNEEFSSRLRQIPFPFGAGVTGSSLEIFHVSHGKWETAAPIRTFVAFDGGASILASYTCTPVVHFSLADLVPGAKVVGRTVAELGAMNQPLDIVSFTEDGEQYLLVSNTSHGLIKIAGRDIAGQEPLTTAEGAGRRAPGDQGPAGYFPAGQPERRLRARAAGRRGRPASPALAEDRLAVADPFQWAALCRAAFCRAAPSGPRASEPPGRGRRRVVALRRRRLHPAARPGSRRGRPGPSRPGRIRRPGRGRPRPPRPGRAEWTVPRHGRAADPRRRRRVLRAALSLRGRHQLHRRRRRRDRRHPDPAPAGAAGRHRGAWPSTRPRPRSRATCSGSTSGSRRR